MIRPPDRAHAAPRLVAILAVLALGHAHAGPNPIHWAAPVTGAFYDDANWVGGVGPLSGASVVIDAVGAPYIVGWTGTPAAPNPLPDSIIVDSPDAALFIRRYSLNTIVRLGGDLTIQRGLLDLQGRITGAGTLRIGSSATMDIGNDTSFGLTPGATLNLNVVNEGTTLLRGGAGITQLLDGLNPTPSGIKITNQAGGIMRFEGGNAFGGGLLDNHGLINIENDPQFENNDPSSFGFTGSQIGRFDFADNPYTVFNNSGVVRVHQGMLGISADGVHSGRFELLTPDSTLLLGAHQWFLPGSSITGPGLTRIASYDTTIEGVLNVENDLELRTNLAQSDLTRTEIAFNVGGTLHIQSHADVFDFASGVYAGIIETMEDQQRFLFHGAADVAFAQPISSAEFFGPAHIRGELVSDGSNVFHEYAHIEGSVRNSVFMSDAFIGGDASRVEFQRGGSVGGDLTGTAQAVGRVEVGGNLDATTGTWNFLEQPHGIGSTLNVLGDITITQPFTIEGALFAGGNFSAIRGKFENITADTVRFGAPNLGPGGEVSIGASSRINASNGPATIERTRITIRPNGETTGQEVITFRSGFEIMYAPITQFTRSGFNLALNADTGHAQSIITNADSILAGTLDVTLLGDAANLAFGDSFTIIEARNAFEIPDAILPILTGEFDRLFLPALPDDLSFRIVYEPNAVRLVVVPAPSGALLLSGAGGLIFIRRRRATGIVAASLLACAGANAGPTMTRWAAPLNGNFADPTNWVGGVLPSPAHSALIDATGSPYEVQITSVFDIRNTPIVLNSDNATLRFLAGDDNFTLAAPTGSFDILRGQLAFGAGATNRDLAPISISENAALRFEGSTHPLDQRVIQVGRDINLGGQGVFEGRATLQMQRYSFFPGFPPARLSIAKSASVRFDGGNYLDGGIITNLGTMRFINDPLFNEPGTSPPIIGSVIGGEHAGIPEYDTTFVNNGLVMVERGDLTLGSLGIHEGEFNLAAGARLVLARAQSFGFDARITGAGSVLAESPDLIHGFLRTEGNLQVERTGVFNAALDIGSDFQLLNSYGTLTTEFNAPVRVGGTLVAPNEPLIFRNTFEGQLNSEQSNAGPRSVEFLSAAHLRGSLNTYDLSIFHDAAIVDGSVSNTLFESTALIAGSAAGSTFRHAAVIGGNLFYGTIEEGAIIGGSLSGRVTATGPLSIGGDLIQENGGSTFGGLSNRDTIQVGGDVFLRSPLFTTDIAIVAQGDFATIGGSFASITADMVQLGMANSFSSSQLAFRRAIRIEARDGRAVIQRTQIYLNTDVPISGTEFITFGTGFEILYTPITQFTRAGFNLAVNADTGHAQLIITNADSILAGTLDIGIIGDLANFAFGDTFTLIEGQLDPYNPDAILPIITGEFDRLFLPTLANGLSFDLVYEPNAVRLVVVPAPASLLALGTMPLLWAGRRRRSTGSAS